MQLGLSKSSKCHVCHVPVPAHKSMTRSQWKLKLLQPGPFKALHMRTRIRLHKEQYDDAIVDFHTVFKQAEFANADTKVCALCGELEGADPDTLLIVTVLRLCLYGCTVMPHRPSQTRITCGVFQNK
jgi:hypothetical protein